MTKRMIQVWTEHPESGEGGWGAWKCWRDTRRPPWKVFRGRLYPFLQNWFILLNKSYITPNCYPNDKIWSIIFFETISLMISHSFYKSGLSFWPLPSVCWVKPTQLFSTPLSPFRTTILTLRQKIYKIKIRTNFIVFSEGDKEYFLALQSSEENGEGGEISREVDDTKVEVIEKCKEK